MVLTLPHPTLGDLDVPGSPLRLSERTDPRREAPPALGAIRTTCSPTMCAPGAEMTDRVAVVGGGIVGVAIAREILTRRPDAQVTLFEKEDRLAAHQTGRNSGVVHAGLYYQPGSNKALLCRRGVGLLEEFCAQRGIRRIECGKVLVALDDAERARLGDIEERALANGVPGVRTIGPEELRELEPHVRGVAALHSPTTSIVDFAR